MSDPELTPRQLEIAALIAEGLSNAEIAARLVLTPGTVGNHVAHVMRALGLRNRVQVAVWTVERGLYRSDGRTRGPRPPGPDAGRAYAPGSSRAIPTRMAPISAPDEDAQ